MAGRSQEDPSRFPRNDSLPDPSLPALVFVGIFDFDFRLYIRPCTTRRPRSVAFRFARHALTPHDLQVLGES
jgi:hypothetical protein